MERQLLDIDNEWPLGLLIVVATVLKLDGIGADRIGIEIETFYFLVFPLSQIDPNQCLHLSHPGFLSGISILMVKQLFKRVIAPISFSCRLCACGCPSKRPARNSKSRTTCGEVSCQPCGFYATNYGPAFSPEFEFLFERMSRRNGTNSLKRLN